MEDSGYQMPKAMQAYNKLINRDKVFAMVLSLGTPMNIAGMKLMEPKNIPNVIPLSAARQMLDEPTRLRFVGSASYYDQTRLGARYLAEAARCFEGMHDVHPLGLRQGDPGAMRDEAGAMAGLDYAAETTHKPDETDFVGSLQKLNAEGCDLVGLALGVRQVITVLGTAKKLGLAHIRFLGSSGAFHTMLAMVPGGVTEGFFATSGWVDLASRADEPAPAAFIAAYMKRSGVPEHRGDAGLLRGERLHPRAGGSRPRPDVDSLVAALESLDYYDRSATARSPTRPTTTRIGQDHPVRGRGRGLEGRRTPRVDAVEHAPGGKLARRGAARPDPPVQPPTDPRNDWDRPVRRGQSVAPWPEAFFGLLEKRRPSERPPASTGHPSGGSPSDSDRRRGPGCPTPRRPGFRFRSLPDGRPGRAGSRRPVTCELGEQPRREHARTPESGRAMDENPSSPRLSDPRTRRFAPSQASTKSGPGVPMSGIGR